MVKTAKLDKMSGVPDVLSGFLLYLGGYSLWEPALLLYRRRACKCY